MDFEVVAEGLAFPEGPIAMADGWRQIVPDALYFHAARVSPGWNMRRIARIGNNIFYR